LLGPTSRHVPCSAELATTPAGWNNEVWAIDADANVVRRSEPRLH
jgi:hypothetical protein